MKKIVFQSFLILIFAVFLSGCNWINPKDPMEEKYSERNKLELNEQSRKTKSNTQTNKNNNASLSNVSSKKNNVSQKSMNDVEQKNLEYAKKYTSAKIVTNYGDIELEFFAEDSPVTVGNFLRLAEEGFYDGTLFHRVIPDFMIQAGDPNSKSDDWSTHGMGGPGYTFKDEINNHAIVKGSLAMANAGPGTNGSQFFIVTAESTPWLDGKHTNFGQVVSGMDVVMEIEGVETNQNDHPLEDVVIEKIELK